MSIAMDTPRMRKIRRTVRATPGYGVSFVAVLALGAFGAIPAAAASCESLSSLKLPDGMVTLAQQVAAGGFQLPGDAERMRGLPGFKGVPAFCRVTAELKPSQDSDIKIEVWMPISGWNGEYRGQGNGGFAGSINYTGLGSAVSRGYAAASTDSGHEAGGTDASWARGHPEKVADFGYRAIHEMTVAARIAVKAFYGDGPKRSYFASCSDGGREALMEVQRFPEDYDGIIAGAPANYWTRLLTTAIFDVQALQMNPESYIPAAKIPAISAAVLAACDAEDGLSDGILNDPRRCHFDPAALLCKGADSQNCLTQPQATALSRIYAGPRNAKGARIFPGYEPGGEDGPGGWTPWITGQAPGTSLQFAFGTNYFGNMVYENPAWDFRTFHLDDALALAESKTARMLNATDPNLKKFEARGGKLILYHGWSDAAIPPVNTIEYYQSVIAAMGSNAANGFVRLYMVPGMQHCGGGPGPSSFGETGFSGTVGDARHDIYSALERWVEKGTAPDYLIATKYVSDLNPARGVKMTRPLCPYPQIAKYKGNGDTNDAGNFACAAAGR